MGRSCRIFTIDGQTMRTGRPKADRPYGGDEKIAGPPYHFNIITDKENLEKLIQGGQLVTFEEWGTSCIDCWTWYQQPIQVFKYVVFQKYEHWTDDYTSLEDGLIKAFFTADEMWQIDANLMEEIPKSEFGNDWNRTPRCPSLHPSNQKEMSWGSKRCHKLINGEWMAVPYETRPEITWAH